MRKSNRIIAYCKMVISLCSVRCKNFAKGTSPGSEAGHLAAVPLNPGIINTDMLKASFGASASSYSESGERAERAVPFLGLGRQDIGRPIRVP